MKNIALTALLLVCSCGTSYATPEVNLYSARQEALIEPLLNAFTEETGIRVNIISSGADALLKRIQSEGINSPADVLLTTDAGRLYRALQANIFTSVDSALLHDNIPPQYRDPGNRWFGLSIRVRLILRAANHDDLQVLRYEDLADPALHNQICIRSSDNIYNQSLVASLIAAIGEPATEDWVRGLVSNLARTPQGGDRDQIRAAAAGQCSIAVANSYYLAQMLAEPGVANDHQAAAKMSVVWPNQADRGAHVNISGAGVLRTAPNKANAVKLVEFLASDTAQKIYADVNFEYPVKQDISVNPILVRWGSFKADALALDKLGENNAMAVRLMDRAGWK